MKRCWIFMGLLLAGMLFACGQDKPADPKGDPKQTLQPGDHSNDPGPGVVAAPSDAQYTISCQVFTSPDHIEQSNMVMSNLAHRTGMREWHLVHSQDDSTLCYGFYRSFEDRSDAREYQRAQADHDAILALQDETGAKLFNNVLFVPLETRDPPAPHEWKLTECPGFWTLQVLVYKGTPLQRKQAAVDACAEFRKEGLPAFFQHDADSSEVYVGSWPRESVAEGDTSVARSRDPNAFIYVSPTPRPDLEGKAMPDGRIIHVVSQQLNIVDPNLKAMIARFPDMIMNGNTRIGRRVPKPDGSTVFIPQPSYLLQVPHEGGVNPSIPPPPDDRPAMPDNSLPSLPGDENAPGNGHLRSLGQ